MLTEAVVLCAEKAERQLSGGSSFINSFVMIAVEGASGAFIVPGTVV